MWRVRATMAVACLGLFNSAVALVLVNTMLTPLSEHLRFDKTSGGAVATAMLYVGGLVGSLSAVYLEKASGTLMQLWMGLLFSVGNTLAALSTEQKVCWSELYGCSPSMLLGGRLLIGFACGLVLALSPKYLAEASPADGRNAVRAYSQVLFATGSLVGLLLGLPYEFDDRFNIGCEWWRIMFLLASLPSTLQCLLTLSIFLLFKPSHENSTEGTEMGVSSPGEIDPGHKNDQTNETESNLNEEHIDERNVATNEARTNTSPISLLTLPEHITHIAEPDLEKPTASLFTYLFDRRYLRSILLGIGVPVACQLTGVSVFASYSTTILQNAGMERAIFGSVACGIGAVVGSIISVILFDRLNRKALAYMSFSAMAMCYPALSLANLAPSRVSGPLSIVFIFGFVFSFALVCGTMNMVYPTEILPPEIASAASGLGQALSWLCAFVTVLISLAILDATESLWLYLTFFVSCCVSLLFWKIVAIETKGRELEEIVEELMEISYTSLPQ